MSTSPTRGSPRSSSARWQAPARRCSATGGAGQAQWLDQGIRRHAISSRRHLIAALVKRVIQKWDAETVSRKFESYVGRDLQYIRINGTLVGGLVGLLLHLVSMTL